MSPPVIFVLEFGYVTQLLQWQEVPTPVMCRSRYTKMGDISKAMTNTWNIPGKAIRVSVRIAAIVLDNDDLSKLVAETCIDYETLGKSFFFFFSSNPDDFCREKLNGPNHHFFGLDLTFGRSGPN
jgi:hypothetical protein